MGIVREFLAWRKHKKQQEILSKSWIRPYHNHPTTNPATCYGQYKVKNPWMMTDEEAVTSYFNHGAAVMQRHR